jgi:hypothetical protein
MENRLQKFERHRRFQVIGLTMAVGLITAAMAAVAIYFSYHNSHLRM